MKTWLRKFTAISLAILASTGNECTDVHAAGPKKPGKAKAEKAERAAEKAAEKASTASKTSDKTAGPAVDKVASKTDDLRPGSSIRSLPQLAASHPLAPVVKAAEESLTTVTALKDYSTTLQKQERINDKLIQQTLITKIRHEPFSVYMKFEFPYAGREVIYVEGQNKGKFLVHETGFKALAGTLSFFPASKEALAENRYPITQAGMKNMLETVITMWKTEGKYQEVQVKTFLDAKVGEQNCTVFEVIHPKEREYFKFHKSRLYIENSTMHPIRLEHYGWPATEGGEAILMEEYTHLQVKPNLGLTNVDFDKNNPAYDF